MSELEMILVKAKEEGVFSLLPEERKVLADAIKTGISADAIFPHTLQDLLDTYNRPLVHDG